MGKRLKPHVLFVTEKWCDCKPEYGITSSEDNLWGPLEVSGLATYDLFHFDEYYYMHKQSGDEALLNLCNESKPDLMVLTWIPVPEECCNPEHETLYKIRNNLKIPIVAMWFDSVCPKIMALSEELLPFVDLSVVADSTTAYLERTCQPEKYLSMPHPKDPRVYYDGGFDRDIDISFVGSLGAHPNRSSMINWLRNNGIDVYKTGGQREHLLSTQEYAQTYMRSKLTLNFSHHRSDSFQFKGRVFEATLCGAMLLEEENPETTRWFEPMLEYVPFKNNNDLLDKARYYLEHDAERKEIARRGLEKANERYTGKIYWETILKRVGILQNRTTDGPYAMYRQANQKMLADNTGQWRTVGQQSKQQIKSTCVTVAGRKKRVFCATPRHTTLLHNIGKYSPCYQLKNNGEINTQRSVTAELFAAGNYAAVVMTGNPDEWQTFAAMGLVGKAQEAIEGLSRFDHPEARFYSAVASWIDGDEITAASILGKIPTLHAQNLLTLIRKPQIQVLSQFPTREYFITESMEDRKFQVRNLGFFPEDLQNEPHADIHKFYDFHNPPDFYICKVVEWHQIPPNIQELHCPIFGATVDYDVHVQTVYPWLRLFDELTVPDPSVWEGVHKLVQVPVSTFPKFYSVPARLPPIPTGPREIDVFLSGTVLHPYHPDKSQLLHQILSRPDIKSMIVNKHLNTQTYMKCLANSKVCYAYVRFTASMPTRALDALSMGCAVVIQKGSVLGLYLGEEHGVLTYELESENLAPTIRHILDHWPEFEQRARQGAAIVRREFAMPRTTSQYLRFLTFLAAKPRGQRQMQPAERLVQKRYVFKKGYFQPGDNRNNPTLDMMAGSSLARLRTRIHTEGPSSCLLIDSAREIALCCRNTWAMSNIAQWLSETLNLYRIGIANFPQSLVLRLNFIRVALQFGQTQETEEAIQLAKETLNTPASNWTIDVMEDVFPWDFGSTSFNYRKYFELVTEHLTQGTPVNSALTQLILAALYFHLGHYSNDPNHFKQAFTLDPEFPFYRFYYAKILIQRGQPEDYTRAGILLTQLAENSILFVEAFSLLKQLQEKQLYISPKFEELAAKVLNYSFNHLVWYTWIDGHDFTTNFLDGL